MNGNFLSRLYLACTCEDSYVTNDFDLGSLYVRDKAADDVDRAFTRCLFGAAEPGELELLHNAACLAYEEQGFMNGFRLGMMLARELS